MKKLNLAVLCSGGGTNLQSIIDAIENKELFGEIKIVISNNSKAFALERANKHNISALHLSHKQFATPEEFDQKLLEVLKSNQIDMIILAGYMKMLSPTIIRTYKNKILNIHPALLPHFGGPGMYGIHVHEAVIKSGVKITGVTVHIVDEVYDHGAIVMQKAVEVKDDDTPETLAERVLKVEHQTYKEAIQLFAEDKVEIRDNKTYIKL
ncbi:MAG: phosphoribosylglycinamide formyltransferase [candidate division Zixibacteria bacterium]|nr:phosphoribosylglycinamide formyltransferase [candidate division Zixibacteria bacterium]